MSTIQVSNQNNFFVDIWHSFRSLPLWVQVWTGFFLMPINMASIFFLNEDMGGWITFLAYIAMLLNIPLMLKERGFSRLMALPHVLPWTILVLLLLFSRPDATGNYDVYLWALLGANMISLCFDYTDSIKWFNGDRGVIGRETI